MTYNSVIMNISTEEGRAHSASEKRKLLCVPSPTHRLLKRVASIRGESMSDTLYTVLRDELQRQEGGDTWAFVPPPFSIKSTYLEHECAVLCWHPMFGGVILTKAEAVQLADALQRAVDGDAKPTLAMTTTHGDKAISLSRGGRHFKIHVGDQSATVTRPVAIDVVAALDSASVHAGPLSATVH